MRADTYVYFIRAQDGTGPIKIGCSRVPAGRLKDAHFTTAPGSMERTAA